MSILFILIVNLILGLNIIILKSTIIGAVFLLLYLLINGYLAGNILKKMLNIKGVVIRLLIGMFLIFSLVSFFGGAFIVLYKFNNVILSIITFLISLTIIIISKLLLILTENFSICGYILSPQNSDNFKVKVLLFHYYQLTKRIVHQIAKFILNTINLQSWITAVYIAIGLLFLIGCYTLFSSSAPADHIITPWQAIPNQFIWVIVLLSILILGLIFFKPARYLLIFIVLFSLLQHLYIPAVYRLPYGLDDWRHIGKMEIIAAQGQVEPKGIIQGITSPKLSYSSFWAGALFLRENLNINLVDLTVWWQMLFFSLFLPILMYVLGKTISLSKTKRFHTNLTAYNKAPTMGRVENLYPLLAAFLPSLFYPMQLYGAISLPMGFGFLFFLFFLITVIGWLKSQNPKLKYLIIIEFVLMFFGYIIYWLIAVLIIGFLIVYRLTFQYHQSVRKKLIRIGYLLASLLFIPIISLWASPNARFDILTTQMDYFRDFWAHNLQYFFGFKAIGSPRPQAGNLIWHNMGGQWYFDTILLVVFLVLIVLGLRRLCSDVDVQPLGRDFLSLPQKRTVHQKGAGMKPAPNSASPLGRDLPSLPLRGAMQSSLILYLFIVSIASIFLDRYYFGGIHLLTERLDLIVDFSLILVLIIYLSNIKISQFPNFSISQLFLIFFLSFTIASTYISGPVYGRATEPHYQSMQLIYQDMRENNRLNYCVLSEHFPLAALEAASDGKIINGNFPIKYGYLEKSGKLFIKMFSQPNIKWIKKAMRISNASGCYLVLDSRFTADWNKTQIRWILGREVFTVDDVLVWVYHET